MAREAGCQAPPDPTASAGDSGAQWDSAARKLDEVAAALFDGDYLSALRLARVAARQLDALSRRQQTESPSKIAVKIPCQS